MGILSINEHNEFVDRIKEHADVEITGGKYFLGKFKERSKLIEEIQNISMPDNPVGCCFDIQDRIVLVMGYKPTGHTHYVMCDKKTGKKCWIFDYQMPGAANHTLIKAFHIRLVFK